MRSLKAGLSIVGIFAALFVIVSTTEFCAPAWAQSATASILGQVTDPQSAAVPGTKITVTNVATGVASQDQADGAGRYRVFDLPIGTYVVDRRARRLCQAGNGQSTHWRSTSGAREPANGESAQVSQTVEVSGVAANVETVNPTLGESVTSRPVVNLPLNGRNVLQLALLQPGVSDAKTIPSNNERSEDCANSAFQHGGGREIR